MIDNEKASKETFTKLCQNPFFGLLSVVISQSLSVSAETIILMHHSINIWHCWG